MHRFLNRSLFSALVVALIVQLAPLGAATAQDTSALTDEQVRERLAFISTSLQAGKPRAATWWYGWIAGYSAGAVAGGILAAANWEPHVIDIVETPENTFAEDMLVGGATCALGVVGLIIDPFVPAYAPGKLRRLPENTAEERRLKLLKAEELLRKCARREKSGRSLTTHLLNLGANAAAGIVTAAAFDRPATDGLVTFALGEAVSLLNIFSQPMRATRDLRAYEAGSFGKTGSSTPGPAERRWSLSVWPGGLSFRLQF